MEKLSEIISKKVISIGEGEEVGYILCPIFEDKNLLGFSVCDEESELEKFLSIDDLSFCGDEVFIPSIFCMQNVTVEEGVSPLGKLVYSSDGQCLGRIEECFLEKNKIKKLQTNLCEIMQKNIAQIGKDFVIFQKNNKKSIKNAKKSQKNVKLIENLPKVEILNKIENENNYLNFSSTLPIKVIANKSSVLGKKLVKDVYGFNNEIIGKENEIITEKMIKKAVKHNKYNFLLFCSK